MDESHIDKDHLRVTGRHKAIDAHVEIKDDILIVVTQAYGPDGDNLVGISDVTFDGYPAVTLLVKAGDREGHVHLSPIHGDNRKQGFTDIETGTVCQLYCPISKKPLDAVADVEGDEETNYFALYLTPAMEKGSTVMISDVWGHYHSRIVDNFELISYWANQDEGVA